jgi:integrase
MTGFREQEVQHACWSDVNLNAGIIRMTHKADFNWSPKGYKEREVPISEKLVKRLKAWRKIAKKNCHLLFPTSACRPNLHFLESLKAVAERAKLNPDDCWLHKFRATFATRCLQSGVDLRTVQAWLGHDDLQSTMRYLRPARTDTVRAKMDEIFG